jgi:hydrogenase/urease accessory protein HupE
LRKAKAPSQRLEIFAVHLFGIGGFSRIVSFFMHMAYADRLAESIGWPAGNPFQTEVAVANLAIGILGFLVFFRRDFMLPYVIAASIFGLGAGATHIIDIAQSANFAPGNAGPILYADFFAPLLRIGLYIAYARSIKPKRIPDSPAG